jgi:hypothetical protein
VHGLGYRWRGDAVEHEYGWGTFDGSACASSQQDAMTEHHPWRWIAHHLSAAAFAVLLVISGILWVRVGDLLDELHETCQSRNHGRDIIKDFIREDTALTSQERAAKWEIIIAKELKETKCP